VARLFRWRSPWFGVKVLQHQVHRFSFKTLSLRDVPSAFAASVANNAPLEQQHTITLTNTLVWQYEVALCPGFAYTFEPVP
jgi:hypothetical protein